MKKIINLLPLSKIDSQVTSTEGLTLDIEENNEGAGLVLIGGCSSC